MKYPDFDRFLEDTFRNRYLDDIYQVSQADLPLACGRCRQPMTPREWKNVKRRHNIPICWACWRALRDARPWTPESVARRKANGLCVCCGQAPAREARTACVACAAQQAASQRASQPRRYAARKAAGLCVLCGHPNDAAGVRCAACCERAQRQYAAKVQERR